MKKYLSLLKISISNKFSDPGKTVVWVVVGATEAFVACFVWVALLGAGDANPQLYKDVIGYYLYLFIIYYIIGGIFSWGMKDVIMKGKLSVYLVIPMFPFARAYFSEMAWKLLGFVISVPLYIFLVGALVGFDSLALTSVPVLPVIGAVILGNVIFTAVYMVIGLSAIWFGRVDGLMEIIQSLTAIFGGFLAPVYLYPEYLKTLVEILPFRYIFSFSIELLQNKIVSTEMLKLFIIALIWSVLLTAFAIFFYKKSLKRYEGYGG